MQMQPIRGARAPNPESREAPPRVQERSTMCFSFSLLLPRRLCRSVVNPTVEIPNVPAPVEYVHGDSDDEIRLADQRLGVLIFVGPGLRDHSHVKVVFRAVRGGRKQPCRAHRTHWIGPNALALIKDSHRPRDVDRAEFNIICSVALAVRAVLIPDRFELLISPAAGLLAESRHGGFRHYFDVVDTIVNCESTG